MHGYVDSHIHTCKEVVARRSLLFVSINFTFDRHARLHTLAIRLPIVSGTLTLPRDLGCVSLGDLKLDSWSGSYGFRGAKKTMILKRIILPWQPWALWLTNGVPRWRSQRILSGRSEKDGRTGTVCRITTLKSPPIRSVLVLVQILESMNVNTSNCKSFHSIYKLDPQHNHFSLPSSLKSCFPRIFKVQGTTKVAAVYFSLDAAGHKDSFWVLSQRNAQITNPKNPDLDLIRWIVLNMDSMDSKSVFVF